MKFSFWDDWSPVYRMVCLVFSVFILLLLFSFLIFELAEISFFYHWKITSFLDNISYVVFSNHSDFLESTVSVDIPVIYQKVFGASSSLPSYYSYIYLGLLYLGLASMITMSSYLDRFWYILSMTLFVLIIALSGMSKVGIFGFYDQVPITVICLFFLSLSYYFQSINITVSIGRRFLAFAGLFLLLMFAIRWTSEYQQPLLYLTRFSYLPALLITVIFILLIGHEIIYAILLLTTPYSRTKSSYQTTHFILLSSVYLLNLTVIYLDKINYIDWNLYYLNPFILLGMSAILGVWGLKSREKRYQGVLPFRPFALYLYLSIALVAFSTLLFQSLHANDPFLEAIGSISLYSHLGFGSMFFLYIIANFITQLKQNLPVHQFAYQEANFPYISARIAGAVIVASLFFRMSYASLHLSVAGYYNGLGDLTTLLDKPYQAVFYYKQSKKNSTYNHHANFALAENEAIPSEQLTLIKSAIKKQPSPYSYAFLGKAYENNNQFFKALFAYQEGLRQFPDHWALQNNLGLLYSKISVVDSALYYLQSNPSSDWSSSIMHANIGAVGVSHKLSIDAMLDPSEDLDRFDVQSNLLASRLINHLPFDLASSLIEPHSTLLNIFTFSYLKNLGLIMLQNGDHRFLSMIEPYLKNPQNAPFREDLRTLQAFHFYQNGKVAEAFDWILQLKQRNERKTQKWDVLLGKWCLELGAPLQASKYFETAHEESYSLALLDLSFAYNALGDSSIAQFLLRKEAVLDSLDPVIKTAFIKAAIGIENHKINWKKYDFHTSEQLLAKTKVQANDKIEAKRIFEILGYDNPFYENGVIAAATFFQTKGKDADKAYDILQKAIVVNLYSSTLMKAYISQCVAMGLTSYADDILERLEETLSSEEFDRYIEAYKAKKKQTKLIDW